MAPERQQISPRDRIAGARRGSGRPPTGSRRVLVRGAGSTLLEYVSGIAALAGAVAAPIGDHDMVARSDLLVDVRHDGATEAAPPDASLGTVEVHTPQGRRRLDLPRQAETLLELLAGVALPARAHVVAIMAASGGIGASSLAAVLTRRAVRCGLVAALVDLDDCGPGIETMLGIDHDPGPRWCDLTGERGAVLPDRLLRTLPSWLGVKVLSADRRGGAVLTAPVTGSAVHALAQSVDLVVLDLPRHALNVTPGRVPPPLAGGDSAATGDASSGMPVGAAPVGGVPADATSWLTRVDDLVAVVRLDRTGPDQARGLAQRCADRLPATRLSLVARGPSPGAVRPEDLAQAAGAEVAAVLRSERSLPAGTERGAAPGDQRRGPLMSAARRLAEHLGLEE